MKAFLVIVAIAVTAGLHPELVAAGNVCTKEIRNGQGYDIRLGGSELCKTGSARDVDLYTWPGYDKPHCDKVTKILPPGSSSIDAAALEDGGGNAGCDHVFELNFLSTYLNTYICPVFDSNNKFDTDQKKIAVLEPLAGIINGKKNMRMIQKSLEDSVKTKNVDYFITKSNYNGLETHADNQTANGAFVALSSYLDQTGGASINIARSLDKQMDIVLKSLKVPNKKQPPVPQFAVKWQKFINLIKAEGSKASENLPKTCKAKAANSCKRGTGSSNANCTVSSSLTSVKSSSTATSESSSSVKGSVTSSKTVASTGKPTTSPHTTVKATPTPAKNTTKATPTPKTTVKRAVPTAPKSKLGSKGHGLLKRRLNSE